MRRTGPIVEDVAHVERVAVLGRRHRRKVEERTRLELGPPCRGGKLPARRPRLGGGLDDGGAVKDYACRAWVRLEEPVQEVAPVATDVHKSLEPGPRPIRDHRLGAEAVEGEVSEGGGRYVVT